VSAEAQLRSRLSRRIREAGGQCTPVETADTAGAGIPDVELCLDGMQAWLELKVFDLPRRDPRRGLKKMGHFRRDQARWMRDRQRLGGRVGLLVMARLPDQQKRRYVMLDAETAAQWWLDQKDGNRWSWLYVEGVSTAGASPDLNIDWVRRSVAALPCAGVAETRKPV